MTVSTTATTDAHMQQQPPSFTKEAIARLRLGLKNKTKQDSYPLSVFPPTTRAFIEAYCQCFGAEPSHYGSVVLNVAGAAIGNSLHVEERGETHPPMLWCILVDPPSSGKTPIMKTGLRPLWTIERRHHEQYEEARRAYIADKSPDATPPQRLEVVLNDATVEAIFKALHTNSRGVAFYTDEVAKLFGSMGRYAKSGGNADEAFFLEAFSGGTQKKSRSKDEQGPQMIFNVFMSILGSTQPGILSGLVGGNKTLNGFLARFLYSYPAATPKAHYHNNTPDPAHALAWDKIISILYAIPYTPALFEDHPTPHIVRLSPGAREAYIDFYNRNAKDINETDDETVQGILGKFDTYVLRMALVLECLRFAEAIFQHWRATATDTPITEELRSAITIGPESMQGAIALQRYYRATALKVVNRLAGPYEALPEAQREWYKSLPDEEFRRSDAHTIGAEAKISTATLDRLLRDQRLFRKHRQGTYSRLY